MKKWIIEGSNEVTGTIEVSGSKNALLAIIPACVITKSVVTLTNVPPLNDTYDMISILKELNVRVLYDNKDKMIIDSRNVKNNSLKSDACKRIRASYYFMGALLSLYRNVEVIAPGGCKFASRPIDLHLYAFSKLGYEYRMEDNIYIFKKNKTRGKEIVFKKVSVGATINAILASCRIEGKITLINVALEPEIDDLINFLNRCGGEIKRVGNSIIIRGKKHYSGCNYKIMDDRIEAGTFLILGSCLGNNLKIIYKDYDYLKSLIDYLSLIGVNIVIKENYIIVNKSNEIKDSKVIFDVYPHIATDLQQPLSILMSKSKSKSVLKDKIYPSRYTQIEDLNKMGFLMNVENNKLVVYHSDNHCGKEVFCKDLRGGVSLVLAACLSSGRSVIHEVEYIKRGYCDLIKKLKKIGVRIYEEN